MEQNNKKNYLFYEISIVILIIFMILITCNKIINNNYCYIKFIESNDKTSNIIIVKKNTIYNAPGLSSLNKYKFLGWFDGDLKFDFKNPIIDDMLLKAKWLTDDVKAPVITLKGNKTIDVIIDSLFVDPGYDANDEFDGNVTNKVEVRGFVNTKEIGTYILTYTVTDDANNQAEVTRTVNVTLPNMIGKDDSIYISINNQKLWFYKNNNLIYTTDIVTGHKGRYDTPKGKYEIVSKSQNQELKGYKYRVFVNFWMPITRNNGVALHDSGRNAFGGNIYTWNGSHGCINLSYYSASFIYKNSTVGTKVLII